MSAVRDFIAGNAPLALTMGGLIIGFVFGAVTYRTNFCTMGSLTDIVALGDYRRLRAWVLAAATAMIGAQALAFWEVVELPESMYLTPGINWAGHLAGGLLFGFGMVFAGGCSSRNLARAGGGDLRSLIALIVMGMFAYMTIGGLLGPGRAWLERVTLVSVTDWGADHEGLGELLRVHTGAAKEAADLAVGALLVMAALVFCLIDPRFRKSGVHVFSGLAVGLCIVAGWALTGLAFDELAVRPYAPMSLTFVRPIGDALEWLQRFTALGWAGFGVGTVTGALLGSFATALVMGRFRVTAFSDRADTLRVLGGSALMGIGGVMGLGCTIGQGLTGISTLSAGSFITVAAIIMGGLAGLRTYEWILNRAD